jgi:hypothetical protein
MKELGQAGAGHDPGLGAAAEALMWLVDETGARAGRYTVDVQGAQGVQIGDRNTQYNEFSAPPGGLGPADMGSAPNLRAGKGPAQANAGDGGIHPVDARQAAGVQVGDHNIQINYPAQAEASSEDMSARRWRVFVSSTSRGLDGFRDAAREVITTFRYWGLECFEPVMMEDFGARDGQVREVCVRAVQDCDLLVGIAGVRYGAHPPDDHTSYTELEFQAAVRYQLSRLMFPLDPDVASVLELKEPQTAGQADRQQIFRDQVGEDRVCAMGVASEDQFRQELAKALRRWVEEDSFKRAMVDHSAAFIQAQTRLVNLDRQTSGTTLIFGEPGTGKTTLVKVLLEDLLLRRSYAVRAGPVTVRLSGGEDAIKQARADVLSILHNLAGQRAAGFAAADLASLLPVLGPRPVLITLYLETDADVDPQTLSALPLLFAWDPLPAVVLAETNLQQVRDRLAYEMRWSAEAVVTVGDYDDIGDALEQMHRDAPSVARWPEDAKTLAEALGLRPISLRDMATHVGIASGGSPRRVETLIRDLLDAIAHEKSPRGRYEALIRNHLDHLSTEARDLLALMTVLHPKPTLFPDEIAVALDLSLDQGDAIRLATDDDEDEDAAETADPEDTERRDRADKLVAELVGRGLLERQPDYKLRELLTLHPSKLRVIQDHLPLTPDKRDQGHARAEAFYRARIWTATESYDSRFRVENEAWWDNAGEWVYHLGHVKHARAAESYASLFLEAFWWWDCYVPSYFCGELLAYGGRPLVQAVSPDMPAVVGLLTQLRRTYPKTYDAARAQILAEIAGRDPARDETLRTISRQGAGIVPILHQLCGRLGITELDALFTDTVTGTPPAPGGDAAPGIDEQRHRLLGFIGGFLADGYMYRGDQEPGEKALALMERCYRDAESHFRAGGSSWDVAWTQCLLGEVISQRGGDPAELCEEAAAVADDEGDIELLAYIERVLADHLRFGSLEEALPRYGRAVFYALALQIIANISDGTDASGADVYTQAFYREIRLHAVRVLTEPLLHDQGIPADARLAEARRRLQLMLAPWGGAWEPDPARLDEALRAASRDAADTTADTLSDVAFPPGPDDDVLGFPGTRFHRDVRNLIERARSQPWVNTQWAERLTRWDDAYGQTRE